MASIVVNGDTSGAVTLSAPAVAGTVTVTLPAASGTMASLASVTANGVAYVNSSSQPTSSSALTWSGTLLSATTSVSGNSNVLSLINSNTAAGGQGVAIYGYSSNGSNSLGSIQFGGAASLGGNLDFYTANSSGTNTLNMRLNASGNLGIGTTSPNAALELSRASADVGLYITRTGSGAADYRQFIDGGGDIRFNMVSSYNMRFFTADTERCRIDSSGNFRLGNTSGGTRRMQVESASANFTIGAYNTNATPYGFYAEYSTSPNNTAGQFFQAVDSTTTRMEVRSNGGLANYSANNVNLSDRREKTNFALAKSYLDVICAIPIQTFNYIDQNLEEDGGLTLGVVAQDVQAVAPELVMESNWGTEESPKQRLSIYQTDLQYALMKCIQELKAEFDAYKASHP
jgi:hypothetical protein